MEDSGLDPPAKKRAQNSEDDILQLLEDVANPTSKSSLSLTTEGEVQLKLVKYTHHDEPKTAHLSGGVETNQSTQFCQ